MRTDSDFQIKACSRKDLGALFSFLKTTKDRSTISLPLDKRHFLDKYRKYRDSSCDLNLYIIKYKNEKIIGCSGHVPFKGLFGAEAIEGFVGADSIIDPDYRERFPVLFTTLFFQYEKYVTERGFLFLNFPFDRKTSEAFQRFGWEEFIYLKEFFKPLIGKDASTPSSSIEMIRVEHFDEKINAFFKKVSSGHHFLLYADCDFLNWKYLNNPYHEYIVVMAVKNREILGYIVAEEKDFEVHIVDIVVDLEYPQAIILLIYKSLSYFDKAKIGKVICCLSHERYITILKKVGFIYHRKRECLFLKMCRMFSPVIQDGLSSCDRDLYHLNGVSKYLY